MTLSPRRFLLLLLLGTHGGGALHAAATATDPAFADAIAAWHLADLSDSAGGSGLTAVGAVTVGQRLDGAELAEALACGDDGRVARFDGGWLDAGQGAGGALNPVGAALTVSVRLRSAGGDWGHPLFSKHGGHERLVYNLYSSRTEIGFELGTSAGLARTVIPVARIGAAAWHTITCRYDGAHLQMFADGVALDENDVHGPLRTGNTVPCLIGAEQITGTASGWKGDIDHVAIWKRALSDAEIARLSGGAARVAAAAQRYSRAALLPPAADLYEEQYRPRFHFTARQWSVRQADPGQREEGWLNDLNGLLYDAGEYHLFAQRWNKCWIHAVSTDLVHWTELQPAFWDDSRYGTGVQSGGGVVDARNTSGLGDATHPPLVVFWAGNDNLSICISYSLDHGRTWTKYAKNPVLRHGERDPKVFWHEPTRRWVMVLYGHDAYHLLTSPDLLEWTDLHQPIANSFECPDMFELPLDGGAGGRKWVLVRGNGRYSVGAFDGARFAEETPQLPCDQGPNFYATMSWGGIAGQPDRRVQVAWMRSERMYPGMPFNQQVSFPCDLTLRTLHGAPRLFRAPVAEIAALHGAQQAWHDQALADGASLSLAASGDAFHVLADVEVPAGASLAFRVRGTQVVIGERSLGCAGATAATADPIRHVELLIDRTSIEAFANHGEVSMSACYLAKDGGLEAVCSGGSATIRALEVYAVRSMWQGQGAAAGKAP
jgi:sucrose-6-phosphate hydrolase SacC (GH32 family)